MMRSRVRVLDSHTGGEPTRVVLAGGPELGLGTPAERLARLRSEYDHFRSAVVSEPRGSEAMVGALLCETDRRDCAAGVIFFDNAGYLGMCGHGSMGVVVSLAHLGRIGAGFHRLESPVGVVTAELHRDGRVTIANVPSYRLSAGVEVTVPGLGRVTGDVAWGGNWFFLVDVTEGPIPLDLAHVEPLTDFAWRVRRALGAAGITGAGGAEIDHVELFAPATRAERGSRNFVLCPGKAYDRSPCGTGTSAKLSCLYADGELGPGETWRQESITGSVFHAAFTVDEERPGAIFPRITGSAHVTGETELILDARDPLRWGRREQARAVAW
jgi:4-hydroxyproline epimerase